MVRPRPRRQIALALRLQEAREISAAAARCPHRAHDVSGNFRCACVVGEGRKPCPHCRPDGGAERMTDKTATLSVSGSNFTYPVIDGSVGPEVVDIRKFYGE